MTERREAIDLCLTLAHVYEDYPFDEGIWAAMRHEGNKKIFALIYEKGGKNYINFKHTPENGIIWRELYGAITPAYHMNKVHWSTVLLDGSIKDSTMLRLLEESYDLTRPKIRRARSVEEK